MLFIAKYTIEGTTKINIDFNTFLKIRCITDDTSFNIEYIYIHDEEEKIESICFRIKADRDCEFIKLSENLGL